MRWARLPVSRYGIAAFVAAILLLGVVATSAVAAPVNTSPPSLFGNPAIRDGVTARPGTWSGSGPLTHAYQWQRCASFHAVALRDAPISYWRLGESSGAAAADESPAGNVGTYSGSPTFGVPGAVGDDNPAVLFDGSSAYVSIPSSASLNSPTTAIAFEAWVKPDANRALFDRASTPRLVLRKNNAYAIWMYADLTTEDGADYVEIDLRIDNVWRGYGFRTTAGWGWVPGAWNHFIATYDGSRVRLYRNGAPFTYGGNPVTFPQTGLLTLHGSTNPLWIGAWQGAGTGYRFPGVIDEVAVYPTALSSQQAAAHYAAGTGASSCVDIPGAIEAGYSPTVLDIDHHLRAIVTATDSTGSASAPTPRTKPVSDEPAEGDSSTSDDPNAIENPLNDDPDPSQPNDDYVRGWECPPEGCPAPSFALRALGNSVATATINRGRIAEYAENYHGNLVNTRSSQGYHPNFPAFENDCQNFVSQALHYGGWPQDQVKWFYNHRTDFSSSWVAVFPFKRFAQSSGRGRMIWYLEQARVGDVVFADWNGNRGGIKPVHSAIVNRTVGTPGQPGYDLRLTYHTNNRYDKSFRALRAENEDAIFWVFHLHDSF